MAKYNLFEIAGRRCLSEERHEQDLDQITYLQCMCDAGVTSYCFRVPGWSTATPGVHGNEEEAANATSSWHGLDSLFEEVHRDSHQPGLTYDVPEKSRGHLDIGAWLFLALLVVIWVVYAVYHCAFESGGGAAEGAAEGAPRSRRHSTARRRSSAR